MSELKFAVITPSYQPDFARCSLLAESIDKFACLPVHHYIIVDRRDYKLFKQLETSNRTVVTVESILPWWIYKIPLLQNGWFSLKTFPLRNWLIQQIVKLEIANHIIEDVLIFVDSDVFFIKPFSDRQFIKDNKVRLFRKDASSYTVANTKTQLKWSATANSLLGLNSLVNYDNRDSFIRYVGNFITWKRDNVLLLHQHIEQITQKSWIEAIANHWNFSEYMLYGVFVDRILQENSGHYWDCEKVSHDYWGTKPMSKEQLQVFLNGIVEEHFAVMISAKSNMSVADYQYTINSKYDSIPNNEKNLKKILNHFHGK